MFVWSNENTSPWTHTHLFSRELRTVFEHTYDITSILHVRPKASQWPLFKTGFQLFPRNYTGSQNIFSRAFGDKLDFQRDVRTSSCCVFCDKTLYFRQEVRTSPDAFVATTLAFFNETSGRFPDDFWQKNITFHSGHQDVCCCICGHFLVVLQQQNNDILMRSQDISSLVFARKKTDVFNETSGRFPDDFWQQSIIFNSGHQDVCCRIYSNKTMIFWWGVRTSPVLFWRQNQMFLTRPQDNFQTTFGNRILYFIQDITTSAVVFVDTL